MRTEFRLRSDERSEYERYVKLPRGAPAAVLFLVMINSERYWAEFTRALCLPDLGADERFRGAVERYRNSAEWVRMPEDEIELLVGAASRCAGRRLRRAARA